MIEALIRRGGFGHSVTQITHRREMACEGRGRNWNDTATNQTMTSIAGCHQKLRQGRCLP